MMAVVPYGYVLRSILGDAWTVVYSPTATQAMNNVILGANEAHFTDCSGRGWCDGMAGTTRTTATPATNYDLWSMRDSANALHLCDVGNPGYSCGVNVWRFDEGIHSRSRATAARRSTTSSRRSRPATAA